MSLSRRFSPKDGRRRFGQLPSSQLVRRLAGGILATLVIAGAAWSLSTATTSQAASGATVTFAFPPSEPPTYILPLQGFVGATPADVEQFKMLMWRPLYWFGNDGQPTFNPGLSLAKPPVFSNGGKTVTIHLNHYLWSDGSPVTSRDVEFWMNLLEQEKASAWYGYVPGAFPDNLVSQSYPNPDTVVFTFNAVYNRSWLLYNQLSQIIPMPQHAWDKTTADGPIGNYDLTASGAQAVYTFLNAEAMDHTTYGSNPLWKVVDGPFVLQTYQAATGYSVFVPNDRYSGHPRPTIRRLVELQYTSDAAEFNALRAGNIDYGYLPATDASQAGYFRGHGYQVEAWPEWGINFISYNYTNPAVAPIFSQLYFRQAMQELVDQGQYIKAFWAGAAVQTRGIVPLSPKNSFLSQGELDDPYPYNPSHAEKLLTSHGWSDRSGQLTCVSPGTGSGDCGKGIRRGEKAAFSLLYSAGNQALTSSMQALQSEMARAGIHLTVKAGPQAIIAGDAVLCAAGTACGWQMVELGGWVFGPDYLPTGEDVFGTGGAGNIGGFSSTEADHLIDLSHTAAGNGPLQTAEDFLAKDVPELFFPEPSYQISVIRDSLRGALPQDPIGFIYPEAWRVDG